MKKPASAPRLTPNHIAMIKLGREVFDVHRRLAEAQGYIRRVQEVESRPAPEPEVLTDGIEQLRRVMANSPEREASQILGAISPELLDRVLGRPDGMSRGDVD